MSRWQLTSAHLAEDSSSGLHIERDSRLVSTRSWRFQCERDFFFHTEASIYDDLREQKTFISLDTLCQRKKKKTTKTVNSLYKVFFFCKTRKSAQLTNFLLKRNGDVQINTASVQLNTFVPLHSATRFVRPTMVVFFKSLIVWILQVFLFCVS